MKHKRIKLYKEYANFNLVLKFKSFDEYSHALEFFNTESSFYPDETNSEFLSLSFSCSNQEDLDATETSIEEELVSKGFNNYYFETE